MAKRAGDSAIERLDELKKKITAAMETSASLRKELSAKMRRQHDRDLPAQATDLPKRRRD